MPIEKVATIDIAVVVEIARSSLVDDKCRYQVVEVDFARLCIDEDRKE